MSDELHTSYQYRAEIINCWSPDSLAEELTTKANQYGDEGWRLISVEQIAGDAGKALVTFESSLTLERSVWNRLKAAEQ